MKQLLLLLALLSPSFAGLPNIDYAGAFFATQVVTNNSGPIRKVGTLPATCTAVGGASSSNAVLYQGRVYQCTATNTWTFAVGQTAALTSGRVPFVTTGGVLTDSANWTFTTASSPNFLLQAANAAHVAAVFRGASAQTADLTQWQNSSGTVLSYVSSAGWLSVGDNAGASTRPFTVAAGQTELARIYRTGGASFYILADVSGSAISNAANYTQEYIYFSTNTITQDARATVAFNIGAAQKMALTTSALTLADAVNLVFNTTTGTKIGTATSQKLAFFDSTPIVQPSSFGQTAGFTAGSGTAAKDDSTYTGGVGSTAYTTGDIVRHLKNLGLIAQ